MNYYALLYDVVDDFANRRTPYRADHLRLVGAAHARGELLLAGALGAPPDGALLVFRAPESAVVEEFARNDPYVTSGLVTRWVVRPWAVVVGGAGAAGGRGVADSRGAADTAGGAGDPAGGGEGAPAGEPPSSAPR